MAEEWRPIEEAPGYQVSNLGNVLGRRGTLLTLVVNQFGYKTVTPFVGGKTVYRQVHRLVAQAFIPNPGSLPIVNHKDGDRLNNLVDNLEWITAKQNAEKIVHPAKQSRRRARAVVEVRPDGSTKMWDSAKAAADAAGITRQTMAQWCSGRGYRVPGGSTWLYREDFETPPVDEEWKFVTPEEGTASIEISTKGRIRTEHGQTCVGRLRGAYLHYRNYAVHRLVAMAFCEKPEGQDVVNHKDGNPQNNCATNLEWTTQQGNCVHANATGLCRRRPVRRFMRDGTAVDYVSIQEASRRTSVAAGDIVYTCQGKKKRAGGTEWRYIDELTDSTGESLIDELTLATEEREADPPPTTPAVILSNEELEELLGFALETQAVSPPSEPKK